MLNQLIAIGLNAVMHYYFGISLMIMLPACNTSGSMSNMIFVASVCLFKMHIRMCPTGDSHKRGLKTVFIDILVHFVLLEIALGIWRSAECLIELMVMEAFFKQLVATKIMHLTELIAMTLAVPILITAILTSGIVQRMAKYYVDYKNRQKSECPRSCYSQPPPALCQPPTTTTTFAKPQIAPQRQSSSSTTYREQTVKSGQQYRDPRCPLHGDHIKIH